MRGVNKLVMEIKSDGEYFEKALLFLKPSSSTLSQHEISQGAEKLLGQITKKKEKKSHNVAFAFLWSAAGAGFMWVVMLIVEKII